jgi:hypothetical protein
MARVLLHGVAPPQCGTVITGSDLCIVDLELVSGVFLIIENYFFDVD